MWRGNKVICPDGKQGIILGLIGETIAEVQVYDSGYDDYGALQIPIKDLRVQKPASPFELVWKCGFPLTADQEAIYLETEGEKALRISTVSFLEKEMIRHTAQKIFFKIGYECMARYRIPPSKFCDMHQQFTIIWN